MNIFIHNIFGMVEYYSDIVVVNRIKSKNEKIKLITATFVLIYQTINYYCLSPILAIEASIKNQTEVICYIIITIDIISKHYCHLDTKRYQR